MACADSPYKVILIGELHERDNDQLSRTLRSFLTKNPSTDAIYRFFREQVATTNAEIDLGTPAHPQKQMIQIMPLEQHTKYEINKESLYDSVIHESFPSALTGVFNLLQPLSILVYYLDRPNISCATAGTSSSVLPNKCSTSNILNVYFEVLVNMEPDNPIRVTLKEMFKNDASLEMCLNNLDKPENKLKIIELFKMIDARYKELLASESGTKYRQFRLNEYPVRIVGQQLLVPIPDVPNGPKTLGLLRALQLDRDELMVKQLRTWIESSERSSSLRCNIVIVGSDHFANMKRLLSIPPFCVIHEDDIRLQPQKTSLVEIRDLKVKPELNGLYGIVLSSNPSGASNDRWRIIVEIPSKPGQPPQKPTFEIIGLKRDNFEVRKQTLETDKDLSHLFTTKDNLDTVIKELATSKGGRKHHRKHRTRHSKSTKHHRKHRTRHSKSTKQRSNVNNTKTLTNV